MARNDHKKKMSTQKERRIFQSSEEDCMRGQWLTWQVHQTRITKVWTLSGGKQEMHLGSKKRVVLKQRLVVESGDRYTHLHRDFTVQVMKEKYIFPSVSRTLSRLGRREPAVLREPLSKQNYSAWTNILPFFTQFWVCYKDLVVWRVENYCLIKNHNLASGKGNHNLWNVPDPGLYYLRVWH